MTTACMAPELCRIPSRWLSLSGIIPEIKFTRYPSVYDVGSDWKIQNKTSPVDSWEGKVRADLRNDSVFNEDKLGLDGKGRDLELEIRQDIDSLVKCSNSSGHAMPSGLSFVKVDGKKLVLWGTGKTQKLDKYGRTAPPC